MKKIGLVLIATNKYKIFVRPLIDSARNFLLKNHKVTYYLFTDSDEFNDLGDDVIINKIEHLSWPMITLYRYKTFLNHKDILSSEDYLFYCDIDMRFVDNVGDEILGDLVSTIHPGFLGGRGTPEERIESTAFISGNEELVYYAGGFNGGSSKKFLEMSEEISKNIDIDYQNGIIAIWHDESHLNKFLTKNKPTVVLSPSYCYPESWNLNYTKKLLALDKNHDEIRKEDDHLEIKPLEIKPHLQWWEANLSLPGKHEEFSGWLNDSDVSSRTDLFNIIESKKINNVLEIGPGIFIDYNMFFSKKNDITYKSIDITNKIVKKAKELSIDCKQSSIEDIAYTDSSFDLVYCRHVMEHLDYYVDALEEMIRVSNKYVCVIFWLLSDGDDIIDYNNTLNLYHNQYSKRKIEELLTNKNLSFEWINSNKDKMLFITKI
jgi:histo-blood group ABO system transferase